VGVGVAEIAVHDAQEQVGAVEVTDQRDGVLQHQHLGDLLTHTNRGGGGEGVDRNVGEHHPQLIEFGVGRPEVVTPHAHAVGLVDHEAAERATIEEGDKRGVLAAFG